VGLFIDLIGICAGNLLWLLGLILLGVGIWGITVKPESVKKMVGLMSLTSGGQPRGFAQRLKGLVEPVDRSSGFGWTTLILGIILMAAGCYLIKLCT
jgi:hypothetical protein